MRRISKFNSKYMQMCCISVVNINYEALFTCCLQKVKISAVGNQHRVTAAANLKPGWHFRRLSALSCYTLVYPCLKKLLIFVVAKCDVCLLPRR